MRQTQRITCKLVYSTDKLYLAIIPKVHMIRGILRIHARCDHKYQVAFSDHLDDLHSTFNASFDTETEWLQWENREAFGRPHGKCILVLIEADAGDLFLTVQLFKIWHLACNSCISFGSSSCSWTWAYLRSWLHHFFFAKCFRLRIEICDY